MAKAVNKKTSAKLAKLSSKVLKGYEPTRDEIEALAASVLAQREKDTTPAPAPVDPAPVELVAEVQPVVAEAPVEAPVEIAPPLPDTDEKTGFWSKLFK